MSNQHERRQQVLAELARTPFRPAWWARPAFLQTALAMRGRRPAGLRTKTWQTSDGDRLHLHALGNEGQSPIVLLLHGLEGGRESRYVGEVARGVVQRGWQFVVLEFRSCSREQNVARRTYHSGETTDLAFVVERLHREQPERDIYVLGFSLGANVLLKWLGESPRSVPAAVRAAAAISPPFDLEVCARRCDERYGGAIARHFLRTLIPKAIAKERQFPGCIDVDAVRRCRTFRAFDDLVTAPLHGFRDARHYWRDSSCRQFLAGIDRPTLLIAAADDPLVPAEVLPREEVASNPFLVPQFVEHGGHVGFLARGRPFRAQRWAEAQALRFFEWHAIHARSQ
ncbi:MAG TPA: alpha/beta fold hydrolase [Planctomycetota bacterium]|nr:alpha/beta fold hydrolase [Planctomycetota bacterium]